MDGDGDVDVLSANYIDDTVAWYENLDGSAGNFSEHIIATSEYQRSVFAIDMDGDGDVDVLSACLGSPSVTWYENLDGSGGSFSTHAITTSAYGARSVFAIDMDGDGDVDVLSASESVLVQCSVLVPCSVHKKQKSCGTVLRPLMNIMFDVQFGCWLLCSIQFLFSDGVGAVDD